MEEQGKSVVPWSYFDYIGVAGCTKYQDRFRFMSEQLRKYGCASAHWRFDFDSPFKDAAWRSARKSDKMQKSPSVFSLTLNHYHNIKSAYELGCERALFLEDDTVFLKDRQLLSEIILSTPSDADVALYDWSVDDWRHIKEIAARLETRLRPGEHWVKANDITAVYFSMVGFSRRGMKWLIDRIERGASGGDGGLRDIDAYFGPKYNGGINVYVAFPHAGVQRMVDASVHAKNKPYHGFGVVDINDYNNGDYTMKSDNPVRKCAFAIIAEGDRYEAYKRNVVGEIEKYIPFADVVDLDIDEACRILGEVPEDQKTCLSRLAIPLMDQFSKYDVVVWLDVDVDITSRGFSEIFDVDTSPDGLAAARDVAQDKYRSRMKDRLDGYDKPVYFNAGILVMDLRKIDKGMWRRKLSDAMSQHLSRPFIMKDQDILNGFFDIKEMDSRFNFLMYRGRPREEMDAAHPCLIHYVSRSGHDMLDEIVGSRFKSDEPSWKSRCIVTSLRHDFIRPWIRAYFLSGNTTPLVIVPGPAGDWKGDDMEYCRAAAESTGGMVFNCDEEWKGSKRLSSRAASNVVGWYSKKSILYAVARRLSPRLWAWIDDDAEIIGDLSECFDEADKVPGFVFTQFYCPKSGWYDENFDYARAGEPDFKRPPAGEQKGEIDNQHPDRDFNKRICWNCMMFFHGDANARLMDLNRDFPIEDDECIFGYLYHTDPKWHDGFYDFSARKWQTSFMRIAQKPAVWKGKMLHYTSRAAKGEVKKHWADRVNELPPAPFEGKMSENAVDAVFVIGTGSGHANEELRYALRSIDKYCPFIRDVYICGVCPSWVDRSAVKFLPWPDRFSHAKDANIIDKLRHACEQPGIARRVLFCSDDQFVTRTCTWDDFAPRWLKKYDTKDTYYTDRKRVWHARLGKTLLREFNRRADLGQDTSGIYYWEPHIWMPMERDKFIEYAKWCDYEHRDDTIIASGYFNFVYAEGKKDYDHKFVDRKTTGCPSATHVAYNDEGYGNAMRFMQYMFQAPSRFEIRSGSKPSGTRKAEEFAPLPTGQWQADMYPMPATTSELTELQGVLSQIRGNPAWNTLLGETSRAEELRLFGVRGWRIVWRDIISRWRKDTCDGTVPSSVSEPRSAAASKVIGDYMSHPESMRTIRFGSETSKAGNMRPAADSDRMALHGRIAASLQRRM